MSDSIKPIIVTFAQFQHSLEEWLSRRQIHAMSSEILVYYAHGLSVEVTASIIEQLIKASHETQTD